jgi:acetyltransferase
MNRNFTLLTHDWVTHVFIHAGLNFINSSGKITIGNNVSFGQNVMVLKGVTIGDNVFIGAGSIVTKDIPSNCIAVGCPCKAIMTLEEYYNKRIKKSREEAFEYARSIVERFGRQPIVEDFWEEFPLFVSGKDVDKYPTLPIKSQLGPTYERYVKEHIAEFENFEAFLREANIKSISNEKKIINN